MQDTTRLLQDARNRAKESGFVRYALDTIDERPDKRRWLYVMTTMSALEFGLPEKQIRAAADEGYCCFLTDIRGGYKPVNRGYALELLGKLPPPG